MDSVPLGGGILHHHPHLPGDGAAVAEGGVAWLLVHEPTGLSANELGLLSHVRAICPAAATAYPRLQQFVRRVGGRPDEWLEPRFAAMGSAVPERWAFGQHGSRAGPVIGVRPTAGDC